MNSLRISCALLLFSGMLSAQVPRDSSYTVEKTVEKVRKKYTELDIEGVKPSMPESVQLIPNVNYKDLGYRQLMANIFVPKESGNHAVVLMIHGGGWRSGSPVLMRPMAEKLAEEGYIVMVPEYRLSLESRYPAAVEDIIDAIKWIKKNEEKLSIDTTNIALIGCSSGGQLATLIGTKFPVQAVVDIDGILAFHHPDSEEGTMAAQWLGGSYDQIPEVWKEASALTHVSKQTPPTLFIASKYPRFLAGHQEYMQALQVFGIKSEIRFMEDAPHSFWLLSPWFQPTLNHVINFLNNTVLKASY